MLSQYKKSGFEELWEEKLKKLLEIKYKSPIDGIRRFGGVEKVRNLFLQTQERLYV